MKITFCGDVHGQFLAIENLIKRELPDIVIQVGDFGIWPQENGRYDKVKIRPTSVPIYFCRGNHENHDLLDTFPDFKISNLKFGERIIREKLIKDSGLDIKTMEKLKNTTFPKADNIYLCESGSILTPVSNLNILFIGGALSIDKNYRKIRRSWWPQETMWKYQIEYILDLIENLKIKIDIIVSHTAPYFLVEHLVNYTLDKSYDPTTKLLEIIYEDIKPDLWVFGHFHKYLNFKKDSTVFYGLDMCNHRRNGKYTNKFFFNLIV